MERPSRLPTEIATALTAAARLVNRPASKVEDTLQMIVDVARHAIPGIDHAGISTMGRKGSVTTRAQTDPLVLDLDHLQYELNEGPCMTAMRQAQVVAVPNIRHEQRWPRYVPRAVDFGLRSQLAVQLYLDEHGTVGGLNLYSTSHDEIDPDAPAIADLFATHAALALEHANERSGLQTALGSRKVIGQAMGIIMERFGIDEEAAFRYLRWASSTRNIKLRAVAEELVAKANTPPDKAARNTSTGI